MAETPMHLIPDDTPYGPRVTLPPGTLRWDSVNGVSILRGGVWSSLAGIPIIETGTARLASGAATVQSVNTPAAGRILLTAEGILNAGALSIGARSAGVSFTIASLNILDARSVTWAILGTM